MKSFLLTSGCWLLTAWLVLCTPLARAQAPAWQTAVALTGTQSYVTATAADASAHVYLTGHFTGTAAFGATTLTSAGVGSDVFVAKWDLAASRFVWAVRAGGSTAEVATAIALSGSNIYVTGWFSSATAAFGPSTLTNATPSSTDLFIAKLTDAGSTAAFGWARQLGGTGYDYGTAIAANGPAVYLAGTFTSPALIVGATTLANVGPALPASSNGFVCKLLDGGSTGEFAWTQRCLGASNPAALAFTEGGLYIAGTFADTSTLASNTFLGGTAHLFVAKLADQGIAGSYTWLQQLRMPNGAQAEALAIWGPSVYLTGHFYGTAQFGAATLKSAGATDVFVAKLTDDGPGATVKWAAQAGGADIDEAYAVRVVGTDVYISGATGSPACTFGPVALAHATNSYFSRDGFVAHLVDAENTAAFTWAKAVGGQGNDNIASLAVSGSSLVAAGYISPAASFDGLTIPASAGMQIGYVATMALPSAIVMASAPAASSPALALWPNPAHATATLMLPGAPQAALTLLDALGRAVRQLPAGPGANALDLTGLAPGLYWVRGYGQAVRLVIE